MAEVDAGKVAPEVDAGKVAPVDEAKGPPQAKGCTRTFRNKAVTMLTGIAAGLWTILVFRLSHGEGEAYVPPARGGEFPP